MTDYIKRADAIEAVNKRHLDGYVISDLGIFKSLRTVLIDDLMALPSADAVQGWIPLSHVDDGMGTDFPYERDGEWVIVTDGKTISVERIKKDAYDHFFPNGRWFELDDVIAWMPLPEPYREDGDAE